ncbi:hypothetical protein DPMN_108872 [Dreissena polymorpha]|uniref:Uncharacterized protein n=1 Tax=Dreissena polymorpha TaxID=45954 RepID=A0A9D4K9Q6_DREPO|nr:hypothetical protein DPMN_108872 [Dreissena polymorpha]
MLKQNFGWAWSMWAGRPRIDRIVIRDVQYHFEVNRCRNEEVNFAHLSGFHNDWAKNVTSRKTAPRQPCYSTDRNHFLTKFHENWAKNVTSRVEKCPPTGGHVFSPIWTIFKLVRDINKRAMMALYRSTAEKRLKQIFSACPRPRWPLANGANKTNVLTNFHDDWAKIVTSRVFTSHVIQLTGTIFELNSHIKETNIKNAPPSGGHVFFLIWTIFILVQDINKTNILTNFHDDWAKIVTSRVKTVPPTGSHVIQLTGTTFEPN